jgi:hypothetical protein
MSNAQLCLMVGIPLFANLLIGAILLRWSLRRFDATMDQLKYELTQMLRSFLIRV